VKDKANSFIALPALSGLKKKALRKFIGSRFLAGLKKEINVTKDWECK